MHSAVPGGSRQHGLLVLRCPWLGAVLGRGEAACASVQAPAAACHLCASHCCVPAGAGMRGAGRTCQVEEGVLFLSVVLPKVEDMFLRSSYFKPFFCH